MNYCRASTCKGLPENTLPGAEGRLQPWGAVFAGPGWQLLDHLPHATPNTAAASLHHRPLQACVACPRLLPTRPASTLSSAWPAALPSSTQAACASTVSAPLARTRPWCSASCSRGQTGSR
jgi:hypothetical protein